jgi:hypothetical protein
MEVHGDSRLTQLIILEFLKGYATTETKLLKKQLNKTNSKSRLTTVESSLVDPEASPEKIRQLVVYGQNEELRVGGSLYTVLEAFDKLLGSFLTDFPKNWTSLSAECILDVNKLIEDIKKAGPLTWISVACTRAPTSTVSDEAKERKMLLHLLAMIRERNKDLLNNFALIMSLASMARGHSDVSQSILGELRI